MALVPDEGPPEELQWLFGPMAFRMRVSNATKEVAAQVQDRNTSIESETLQIDLTASPYQCTQKIGRTRRTQISHLPLGPDWSCNVYRSLKVLEFKP